jgi:hypothetical protein
MVFTTPYILQASILSSNGYQMHLTHDPFAEEQAVAGRWRALTKRNLQRSFSDTQVLDTIVPVLINGLVSILVCAGISTGNNEATEMVVSGIRTRLNVVAALALKLNRIIGQDMTSSDLEASLVAPKVPYDMEVMKNAGDEASGLVLCTTDLGLTSCVKQPDRTRKVTFVKPVVVLESYFTRY